MIRVLQGVKKRELEYEAIKTLATHIQGIPADFQLASRERRLIGQGPLLQIHLDPSPDDFGYISAIDHSPSSAPSFDGRFAKPIRSHNIEIPACSPTIRTTLPSHGAPYLSSETPSTPDFRSSETRTRSGPRSYDFFTPPDSTAPSLVPNDGTLPRGRPSKAPIDWIYAFVFTDVVILAKHQKRINIRGMAPEFWELLPGVGITRVLGFRDLSGGECARFQ